MDLLEPSGKSNTQENFKRKPDKDLINEPSELQILKFRPELKAFDL